MKNNPWTVAIVGGLVVALVILVLEILREREKANLPLNPQGAREKPDGTDFDVVNPATKPRRIQEAWFQVEKTEPPSQDGYECSASIDKVNITFTATDYIPKHNAYYKRLGEDEIRAQEEGIFRITIIDHSHVGWKYYGVLVVVYGDSNEPKYGTWDRYYVMVSDVDKPAPPPAANAHPKPDSLHRIPDGTHPTAGDRSVAGLTRYLRRRRISAQSRWSRFLAQT